MLRELHLPFRTGLHGALVLLGEQANLAGRGDIAAECLAVASEIGDAPMTFKIPAADLMARACDAMRDHGRPSAVAALERLVQVLKDGNGNRRIAGTIHYKGIESVSELDDRLETMRRTVLQNAGG